MPATHMRDESGLLRRLLSPAQVLRSWLTRLVDVQFVDRAVAIGAQAFSGLFPLMVVYSALAPSADANGLSQQIIDWLRLSGSAADSVRAALAPSGTVTQSITVIGFVLVIASALSLARALQRMYERCYGLPNAGLRDTLWHLLWIALIPIYITVRPLIAGLGGGVWHLIGSLLLGVLAWLATPYVILARRMPWQQLLPGAVLTAIAMTALAGASIVYMPHSITASAEQFGTIGVAFALLGWLIVAGFVLVGSAAAGAAVLELADRR